MVNSVSLNSIPMDCLINIVSKLEDANPFDDELILLTLSRLSLVSKTFSQIDVEFFRKKPQFCNRVIIAKINQTVDLNKKIKDLIFFMQNKLIINPQRIIMQCEELYGLPVELKEVLEGKVSELPIKKMRLSY